MSQPTSTILVVRCFILSAGSSRSVSIIVCLRSVGKLDERIIDSRIVLNCSVSNFIVTTPKIADSPPSSARKSMPR
ncbi:MAG TPA: hypothetical protein DIW35_11690 [Psychrobacter sp.]|nr:hypothetical protein [Psychrobacter sp.]